MTISFSDGTARQLHEIYREKLGAAWLLYSVAPTVESRDAFGEALKTFADLTIRGEMPKSEPRAKGAT